MIVNAVVDLVTILLWLNTTMTGVAYRAAAILRGTNSISRMLFRPTYIVRPLII
jgi:hypothetical protein